MPAKVWAGPNAPWGGATRTETSPGMVAPWPASIQATIRSPSGAMATAGPTAIRSAGERGPEATQPVADAAEAPASAALAVAITTAALSRLIVPAP